jgi:CelD/BcsL family acetyltransferase involved in cellulose biosynthesis
MSTDIEFSPFDYRSERAYDVGAQPQFQVQCGPLMALLERQREDWLDLLNRPLTENPFLHPSIVQAGVENGLEGGRGAAVIVSRDGQMEGVFPFRSAHVRGIEFPGAATTELNLYHFNGAPLVRDRNAPNALRAWLGAFGQKGVPSAWVLRHVDLEGDFARTLAAVAEEAGYSCHAFHRYQRPRLSREHGTFEDHVKAVLSKRRVKDIRRNLRRLGEQGEVRLEQATEPNRVTQRLEDFLRIEAKGWKGEAGTAFLSETATAGFARAAFAPDGEGGLVSIDTLLVDDKPIAVSLNVQAGDVRFTPKCAIDEDYRCFSPGVLMEYQIIEAFYADQSCKVMDSAITTDAHLVAGLWNEGAAHGDVIVAKSAWRANALAAVTNVAENAKVVLKDLRGRFLK